MCASTFGHSQCRGPLGPQDVQADAAIAVDIRVKDFGSESNLWGCGRITCKGVDGQGKTTFLVRTVLIAEH